MIRTAAFRNFKGLRDVKLDFERFTVLVGPNSSGKTSILQGLNWLCSSQSGQREAVIRDGLHPSWAIAAGADGGIELEASDGERGLKLQVFQDPPPDSLAWPRQDIHWGFRLQTTGDEANTARQKSEMETTKGGVLPFSALLRLNPRLLSSPTVADGSHPRMRSDGGGLASALAFLALNQPKVFGEFRSHVASLFPFIKDLRFERARVPSTGVWGDQILFDQEDGSSIPAFLASDGIVLGVGLLTALFSVEHPRLLLIDDLDHGLHPKAQRDFVDLIRRIIDEQPDLQVIATTHSPYLLDRMRPEEIRLTTRLDDGGVACARMDQHPDFAKWKEAMSPGEFWSMVGETWVANGRLQESPA